MGERRKITRVSAVVRIILYINSCYKAPYIPSDRQTSNSLPFSVVTHVATEQISFCACYVK